MDKSISIAVIILVIISTLVSIGYGVKNFSEIKSLSSDYSELKTQYDSLRLIQMETLATVKEMEKERGRVYFKAVDEVKINRWYIKRNFKTMTAAINKLSIKIDTMQNNSQGWQWEGLPE